MTMKIGELIAELSKYDSTRDAVFEYEGQEFPIDFVLPSVAKGVEETQDGALKPWKVDYGVILTVNEPKYKVYLQKKKQDIIKFANESFDNVEDMQAPRIRVSNSMYDKLIKGDDNG